MNFSLIRRVRRIAKNDCELRIAVCLPVRMEQLGSDWTDFHEIWYFSIVRKSVEKIDVLLKSDNNNEYFTWRPMYIYDNVSLISS